MAYEFYGYPADFLEHYRAGFEKVTPADVARMTPKYLHKDQLKVLVVGNASEFDKPLSSLGAVTKLDITIPPPPGAEEAEAKPAASNPEGKALSARSSQAMGGEAKLQSIKSSADGHHLHPENAAGRHAHVDARRTIVFPDRIHAAVQRAMGAFHAGGNAARRRSSPLPAWECATCRSRRGTTLWRRSSAI